MTAAVSVATWVPPGLRAEVRHLRGEETLRHATLQSLHVETKGGSFEAPQLVLASLRYG